jgi:3-isopropylmalate/(R)-2-methylmalate dehydratase large subunit
MSRPLTLFQKIWTAHAVAELDDDFTLLFVDRNVVNDLGAQGFLAFNERGLTIRHPELTFGTIDHTVASLSGVAADPGALDNPFAQSLRDHGRHHGFRVFDVGQAGHGIVHVVTPEQGIALPGSTLACGDSHTPTVGALGAIAWGTGSTEFQHVLATQTSIQRRPKNMRVSFTGTMPAMLSGMDLILYAIGKLGVAGASGHAVEFAGPVVRALPMEARFTLCNLAVEMGARYAIVAPDETTFAYLKGRPHAPAGAAWNAALTYWRSLPSDADASFDKDIVIDVGTIEPQVTWGNSPQDVVGIGEHLPDPTAETESERERAMTEALSYMGLDAHAPIVRTPIDWVFIGSCANSRLGDLRAAADIARGRKVAPHVTAWIVPGSNEVKRAAEVEGLDRVFLDAGFFWGEPGCSMCGGAGDQFREVVKAGTRVVSTSNRNFAGRQGPGSRTHLASPATAAACAIAGCIADARQVHEAA